MPTASIQTPGSRVSLISERLVVVIPPEDDDGSSRETRRDIPLRDLERMVMGEGVSVTSPALMEMLRRHIPISFIDARGRFLGSFQPAAPDHGAARLRHFQRSLDALVIKTLPPPSRCARMGTGNRETPTLQSCAARHLK